MFAHANLNLTYVRDDAFPSPVDYALLATISALLHLCLWLWWSAPQPAEIPAAPPKFVEILLVAPPTPVVVAPPPPPAAPVPIVEPPPPPPPRPKPRLTAPKPKPTPPPKVYTSPPVITPAPPSARPPPIAAPTAKSPSVFVPANTKASSRHNPKPVYPSIARRRGWDGKVLLAVEVLATGKPGAITVAESSGREALDDAALTAVKRWLFDPARQGDTPVSSTLNLSIVFRLEE